METQAVRVVDAFADEPLGGVAIPVLPDSTELTDSQLRVVAAEFGAPAAVTRRGDEIHSVTADRSTPVCAAVAGCLGLEASDHLDPGTRTVRQDGRAYSATLTDGRQVTVDITEEAEAASVDAEEAASLLGLPTSAVAAVDLPVGRADGVGRTLLVPVLFLEHLGAVTPDREALAALEADRVFAFTFDTLAPEADVHARVFDTTGREWGASGVAASGCGRFLATQDAVDEEMEWIRVESGQFCDRPSTLDVTVESGQVAGRGLVTLDGTISVPPDESDEIVEL